MSFLLKWPTYCQDCGERMPEEAEAVYSADGIQHVKCPSPVLRKPNPICGRCYLELPVSGICEECE
jgi:hypothetical protein